MGRFGVTEKTVLRYCGQRYGTDKTKQRKDKLERLCQDAILVTYTSLYAHLLDQLEWGLLSSREVMETACRILRQMQFPFEENAQEEMTEVQTKEHLVRLYLSGLADCIR